MAYRLFEGKDHAASYWKYRICPSDHLIQQVLDFLEKQKGQPFELAVDVGCGSGQGTVLLAKHFASVVGTDVSPAQLEMALQHAKEPNITYRMENEFLQEWVVRSAKIGRAFYTTRVPIILLAFFVRFPYQDIKHKIADVLRSWFKFLSTTVPRQCVAEELPFADSSVDLLTAMSAFHWFDRPRFIKEVHRVLKSRGCLALLNYTIDLELSYPDCCSQTLNQVCKEFYAALQPYRSPHLGPSSIELYREAYESIPYSDKEWQECVWVRRSMPLSSYMGLVESFSSYQALLRVDMQKAIRLSQDICQRFMSIMGVTSAETEVVVGVKYFYLLACKPQQA